jgi:acyl-CoA thioester hydrolase
MEATHSSDFPIRYYECDGYGHVNNANYLRYLEETALAAEVAAGYGTAACDALGLRWQPRTIDIEFLQPVLYGDTLTVATSLTAIAGAEARRAFDFRSASLNALAARAHARSTLLCRADGRPTPIPSEMATALAPGGIATSPDPSEAFPVAPPPPAGVYSIAHRVRWQDLNAARRVGLGTYMEWIEDASFGVVDAFGWPAKRMVGHGFAVLLRRHQLEFLGEAQLDDQLVISTWASDIKRAMATRHYFVTRAGDGELLLRVHTLGVWVELATGRPMRIPQGFLDDFGPNLVY